MFFFVVFYFNFVGIGIRFNYLWIEVGNWGGRGGM